MGVLRKGGGKKRRTTKMGLAVKSSLRTNNVRYQRKHETAFRLDLPSLLCVGVFFSLACAPHWLTRVCKEVCTLQRKNPRYTQLLQRARENKKRKRSAGVLFGAEAERKKTSHLTTWLTSHVRSVMSRCCDAIRCRRKVRKGRGGEGEKKFVV